MDPVAQNGLARRTRGLMKTATRDVAYTCEVAVMPCEAVLALAASSELMNRSMLIIVRSNSSPRSGFETAASELELAAA